MHVHGSLNRLISCGQGEQISVLYKYTTEPVVSSRFNMLPVKQSRSYLVLCALVLISVRNGLGCRDSVFMNSLSIISECRNQIGDMLLLMCQIPSFIDLFDSGTYIVLCLIFFLFVNAYCRYT